MEGHNLSGLVELLFVVGLLFWLWSSQRSALRKDPGADRGAGQGRAAPPNQGDPPTP